jgi:hypothetical protein
MLRSWARVEDAESISLAFKCGPLNAEEVSTGTPNLVLDCRESLERDTKLGIEMPRMS